MRKIFSFKYFLYFSLLFIIYYLISHHYFRPIHIFNLLYFFSSLLFLFIGFIFQSASWKFVVTEFAHNITYKDSFISLFINTFAKYIPGKLGILHGVSAYLTDHRNFSRTSIIVAFIIFNILYLLSGMIIGIYQLIGLIGYNIFYIVLVGTILIIVFFNFIYNQSFRLVSYFLKYNYQFNTLNISYIPVILLIISWIFWGVGFTLFIKSIFPNLIFDFHNIAMFPLATTFSNLAFIFPGGLGLREGILAYLLKNQLSVKEAITVTASSRIWMLIGEGFVFSIALVLNVRKSK